MNRCDQVQNRIPVEKNVRSFFIRILFAYEPHLDKGMPGKALKFQPGDLLKVTNANDSQWWQAVHIRRNSFFSSTSNNLSRDRGLIPSVERVKNKGKSQRRHVEFDSRATVIGPTGKLLSEMINTSGCSSFDLKRLRRMNKNTFESETETVFKTPYEIIEQIVVRSPRPVVVIGPGKDTIYEFLLSDSPDKFSTPVPHTTRPPRPGEKDGVDYHFVTNREELETESNAHKYIDVGKFKGNLYANSVDSVNEVVAKDMHALLDVSHTGIEKLRCAKIYPICVLITSSSLAVAKVLQGDNHHSTLDIQSSRDYTLKLEKEFSILFDVILSPSSVLEMKEQVLMFIKAYQMSPTWVAAPDQSSLQGPIDE